MTLTPNMKKILLVGGAAVVGFIIYRKMKGSSAPAPTAALPAANKMKLATGMINKFAMAKTTMTAAKTTGGLEEELVADEELGSLGGGYR
jgi:hypothetical protein